MIQKIYLNLSFYQKILILCFLMLSILLFRNPFSKNSPISDLEPSPDTIYYLAPVKNFIEGHGFKISYQQREIPIQTPPLYSISLIPIIYIFKDVRAFYFMNILFSFTSLFIFYKILISLKFTKSIFLLLLISFTTNFIIFAYPSFAMAENLLLPLVLFSILVTISPLSKKNIVLIFSLSALFFLTKYISFTLSLALILSYFIKIITSKNLIKSYLKIFLVILVFLITSIFLTFIFDLSLRNKIIFFNFGEVFNQNTHGPQKYFSSSYISNNFTRYLAGLIGGLSSIAGKYQSIIPAWAGVISIPGLITGLLKAKNKPVSIYGLFAICFTLSFICFFYIADSRYLFSLFSKVFYV